MTIIDAHCDTLSLLKTPEQFISGETNVTLEKLQAGGVRLQCLAAFTSSAYHPDPTIQGFQLISMFNNIVNQSQQMIAVRTNEDLQKALSGEKMGLLLTVEGGELLLRSTSMLQILCALGVKMMSLSWNNDNPLCGGAGGENKGLTVLGKETIRQMEQLKILPDVSHASEKTFWDIAETISTVIAASHSNAYGVCSSKRNLKDDQILEIARRSGCIGICFYNAFLSEAPDPSLEDILKHIEYIAALAGCNCIGLGTDFDGADNLIPSEVRDASLLQAVPEALARLNYTQEQIERICWKNWADTFSQVL